MKYKFKDERLSNYYLQDGQVYRLPYTDSLGRKRGLKLVKITTQTSGTRGRWLKYGDSKIFQSEIQLQEMIRTKQLIEWEN